MLFRSQDATIDYDESGARLGALFRWRTLELAAGGYTLKVDGEIDATGGLIGSADFTEVGSSGAYGALSERSGPASSTGAAGTSWSARTRRWSS